MLVGLLTVAHLFDGGQSFPTLVDLVHGSARVNEAPSAGSARIEGTASVTDGDTLMVRGVRIRLYGIDAPERDQTCRREDGRSWSCGPEATAELRRLVSGEKISCEVQDRDRYGRSVSMCRVGGTDIGSEMVRAGLALAYRQYSRHYVGDEAYAERRKVGVWAGTFDPLWDWRRQN